jgi:tRNA dimethylallyltransferase
MINNKVIVILGPTSSGKSDVAIKLAKKFNGEIISADSRQIYKGMDIGTGKVPRSKVKGQKSKAFYSSSIRHHLIDVVNPTGNYNVSHFKKDSQNIIADILKRGKLPIICGGTGFWIKAVVDNVNFPEVKPNWVLRNKLRNKSAEDLFKILKRLDPARAKNIDAKNKVRLIRAIEICKAIGKVPALACHCEGVKRPKQSRDCHASLAMTNNYKFLQIGIKLAKEKLSSNIKKRLRKRFKQGMIGEVVKLKKSGLSWKKIQSFGLGYYWIPQYLKGEIKDKEDLFEKIFQSEKDYAKRQMTWFRKDKRIKWVKNYREIDKEVKRFTK